MKKLFASCIMGLSCLGSLAHAAWDQATNIPEFPASLKNKLGDKVAVIPGYLMGNGQYSDVYYRNDRGGWITNMIDMAPCVFVHYHGGNWTGGDPRYSGDDDTTISTLVNHYVGGLGCIFVGMSYPLAEVESSNGYIKPLRDHSGQMILNPTLHDIIGDNDGPTMTGRTGSVFETFNLFYTKHFQQWKASSYRSTPLQLYVGGESAGAYIAQRVASDGRWAVNASLVSGVPVLNPRSRFKSTLVGSELLDDDPDLVYENPNDRCETQWSQPICKQFRNLYNNKYSGEENMLDLHRYNGNAELTTYYIANICDDLTEVGAALRGWFDGIPANKKRLFIHKGFADNVGHGHWAEMYSDIISNNAPAWLSNGETMLLPHPWTSKYGAYCTGTNVSRIRN